MVRCNGILKAEEPSSDSRDALLAVAICGAGEYSSCRQSSEAALMKTAMRQNFSLKGRRVASSQNTGVIPSLGCVRKVESHSTACLLRVQPASDSGQSTGRDSCGLACGHCSICYPSRYNVTRDHLLDGGGYFVLIFVYFLYNFNDRARNRRLLSGYAGRTQPLQCASDSALVRNILADLLLDHPLAKLPQVRRQRLILCLVRLCTERVIGLSQVSALILFGIFSDLPSGRGPERRFGTLVGGHEGDTAEVVDRVPECTVCFRESGFLASCNG